LTTNLHGDSAIFMLKDPRSIKIWAIVALIVAAVGISIASRAQAQAKSAVVWEYRLISRWRGWTQPMSKNMVGLPAPGYWYKFEDWNTADGDKDLPAGTDMKAVASQLGAEGWELVSVTPVSTFAGDSANAGVGGATTEMLYWFKRARK